MPTLHPHATERRRRFLARQGRALAAARARLGLSQPAAAAALGVPPGTYRSWEHGLRQPQPAVRARLRDAWGVPARALALGADDFCPHCGRRY